jgi:hypothetical protein
VIKRYLALYKVSATRPGLELGDKRILCIKVVGMLAANSPTLKVSNTLSIFPIG